MRLIEYYLTNFNDWKIRKKSLEGQYPLVISEYEKNIDSEMKLRARDTFYIVLKLDKALVQLEADELQLVKARYFDPMISTDKEAGTFLGWSPKQYYNVKWKVLHFIEETLGVRTITSWEREELYKEMEEFW
ncbi:hypothetical protein [Thermoactinomyces sp. DSM 45892]|uniref:hypothetical protein n=1 Tax=Thermoactinomyces sp. DSM 45892 TaxID=1882753 RepID=UPI00089AA061|nr:hypothetical protein [Thermoactinomyces sp. DSM 45892]SDY69045.1 hypothetical protein SAMN05444416_10785 [Thermoactinomyces sp. DSM 45892]